LSEIEREAREARTRRFLARCTGILEQKLREKEPIGPRRKLSKCEEGSVLPMGSAYRLKVNRGFVCRKCGEKIEVGQKVYQSGRHEGHHHYHLRCFQSLLI